jgi:hypothetical protein
MINVKLKTVTALVLLIAGGAAYAAQAGYAPMTDALEKDLVNICEAFKSDSKLRIRTAIKHSGYTKANILDGLVCNGMDPLQFALLNDANSSAEYIAGKRRSKAAVLAYKKALESDKVAMTLK